VADDLAEMRRQYRHATLETHMLDENGEVRLRCARCKVRPVPKGWSFIQVCDPCLERIGTEDPDTGSA
jgi:hypothetical protein